MSGYADNALSRDGASSAAGRLLSKPFLKRDLASAAFNQDGSAIQLPLPGNWPERSTYLRGGSEERRRSGLCRGALHGLFQRPLGEPHDLSFDCGQAGRVSGHFCSGKVVINRGQPAVWPAGPDRQHGWRGPSLESSDTSLPLPRPAPLARAQRRPRVVGRLGVAPAARAARRLQDAVSVSVCGPSWSLAARSPPGRFFSPWIRLGLGGHRRLRTGPNASLSRNDSC